ncbi:MAG TPA: cell division protein ZapA [Polyangiaceae bacterium]|jgi:cell division protein ZapA|nr:cell division protein ZapA [Polyangiaceae bacterium]
MDRASVELRVGGQTFRVVASASADELERLAGVVDGRLREIAQSSAFHPQSMLLVAISLAHELEQERTRRRDVEARSREMLRSLLQRIDGALELSAAKDPEVRPSPDADELHP